MINSKKYFLEMLAVIGIQLGLGINLANAVPCEDKVDAEFNYNGDYGVKGKVWEYLWGNTHAKYTSVEDAKNKLYDTAVRYIDNRYEGNRQECVKEIKYETNGGIELIACMNQVLANNGCDPSVFKRDGASPRSNSSNSKSNQSSNSRTSKQSKSNKQSTNSQSNQSSTNNSNTSSSDDERIKKINEAVDQGNNAHNNKDYAKSIAAINFIVANTSNITLKGEATNRLAEYYKDGHGVPKDEVKAQALFEQASAAGNADADAHICQNYEEGTGGVTQNHQTAIKYCTAAANKGHLISMSKLGYLYHAGIGTINPQLGNEWLCKAAKLGNSTAIGNAEKLKLNCN